MFRPRRRERALAQRIPLKLPDSGLAGRWESRWLNHGTSTMIRAHSCASSNTMACPATMLPILGISAIFILRGVNKRGNEA